MASLTERPGGWYLRDRLLKFDEKAGKMVPKDVWVHLGKISKSAADKRFQEYLKTKPRAEALRVDLRFRELVDLTRQRKMEDGHSYLRSDKYFLNRVAMKFGDLFVGEISERSLKEWMGELHGEGLSQATVAKYLQGLRAMVKWAIKVDRYMGKDPFTGFVIPSPGRPRDVIAEADQIRNIIEACNSVRRGAVKLMDHFGSMDGVLLADIVLLTLTHGLRLGEVIGVNVPTHRTKNGKGRLAYRKDKGIRVKDLQLPKRRLFLQRTKLKSHSNMGVKETPIFLSEVTYEILMRRSAGKAPHDLVFTHSNGKPIFTLYKAFQRFVRSFEIIGFDGRGRSAERFQFRDLRKSAAVHFLASGINTPTVAKMMGHTDSKTTENVYLTRLEPKTLEIARDMMEARFKEISAPLPVNDQETPFPE